jgi:DegV family protein with EDD domain
MRKTAVVTDSAATVPRELAEELEIGVAPMQVAFGLQAFRDGLDMTPAQFYARLATERELPKTTAPSIGDIVAAYEQAAQRAEAIVAVHVSRDLSATMVAALQAAQQVSAPVHVVDSRTGAAAQCLIAVAAARDALSGAGPEDVLATVRDMIERVRILVMLDTLEYLQRGGRIGKAQAWLGQALQFKPIVALKDGAVDPVERPRTREHGIARMVDLMAEDVRRRPVHVAVTHAAALPEAQALRDRLAGQFQCQELLITEFSPVMGAHTGPGLLGIAWWAEEGGT